MIARSDVEARQHAWYVRNCLESAAAPVLEKILLEQVEVFRSGAEVEDETEEDSDKSNLFPGVRVGGARLEDLRRVLRRATNPVPSDDHFEENVHFARDEFGLDPIEIQILQLLLRYERNGHLEQFADLVSQKLRSATRAVAALIGASPKAVQLRLCPRGTLMTSGLLVDEEDGSNYRDFGGTTGRLRLSPPLQRAMGQAFRSREEWTGAIVGPPVVTGLAWDDFGYVGRQRELAVRMLAGALREKARAINVLIHGPVGTGKTELCKVLGRRLEMPIWSVGELDVEGQEPSRHERLAALRLADRILGCRRGGMILFDEAEDALSRPDAPWADSDQSKIFINRILESNAVPVLWTCNRTDNIDPAYLRRMTLVMEVRVPPPAFREPIWKRVTHEAQAQLGKAAIRRLARQFQAPVAIIANAVRVARLAAGGEGEVEDAMVAVLQLLGTVCNEDAVFKSDFDPSLVSCRGDLVGLVDRLARPGVSQNWSLCIHGPPGSGKTEFARYLAHRLGKEVTRKRASDLLSPLVGITERRIAQAFAQARAERAVLLIDEADSLLHDRRYALQSWEVTQVNEMLTWMETHPLPFVCTTNLMDRLDQATLRRFTFKLQFEALSSDEAARAFARFFGCAAPSPLPEGLSPGDFATVRRKADLMGPATADQLAEWLQDEAAAKGASPIPIGFVRAPSRPATQ